eukprot:12240957-Prorocentrum_lima.AAC.1
MVLRGSVHDGRRWHREVGSGGESRHQHLGRDGLGEATEIERSWLQGWCERRGAGEPELEYDPSKLGIHAVLQQITNLLSNHIRTQWLPAQRAKLEEMPP